MYFKLLIYEILVIFPCFYAISESFFSKHYTLADVPFHIYHQTIPSYQSGLVKIC